MRRVVEVLLMGSVGFGIAALLLLALSAIAPDPHPHQQRLRNDLYIPSSPR